MFYDDSLFYMMECSAYLRFSTQATTLQFRIRKVMNSCIKAAQLDSAYKWGLTVITNLYNYEAGRLLGNPLESCFVGVLECLKETYNRKSAEIERDGLTEKDALFIQEIINDLERNGYRGGKAQTMLYDWSGELRNKSGLKGQRKKTFFEKVGRGNW